MFGILRRKLSPKCNSRSQLHAGGHAGQRASLDSDRADRIDGLLGETMGLHTVDHRPSQSDAPQSQELNTEPSSMTPARRAAIDALEREFQDLLKAPPR
jgi:hypothetical protein